MATTAKYEPSMGDMDIIFAGGGTAACVAAGRLAAADLDLKILLIEGGPDNYHDPTVVNPAAFLTHLKPSSNTAIVSFGLSYPLYDNITSQEWKMELRGASFRRLLICYA